MPDYQKILVEIKNGKIDKIWDLTTNPNPSEPARNERVDPDKLEELYERGRQIATLFYEPPNRDLDPKFQQCCTYVWMGGKWVKVCQTC